MGWTRFLRRNRWDDERARELESYLATETDDNITRGMRPAEARAAARRKLGNATMVREEIYQLNTIAILDSAWRDLKYGARLLRLNPSFAIVAILSLALGIGANTAIFQLIDAVRLRTLPVAKPHEIALVRLKNGEGARGSFDSWYPSVTNPVWERIRDARHPLFDVFAWQPASFDIADRGRSRPATGVWVSGNYFSALGVGPVMGRVFTAADDRRGCEPAVVISHAFWQREFGGDSAIVGRTVSLDRHRLEVVGVAEAGFQGLEVGRSFDVALPICAEPTLSGGNSVLDNGTIWWLTVMARMKPGVSIETASAQLASLSPGIFATVPSNYPPESAAIYQKFSLRLTATLSGFFGVLAAVLASVGLYGLMSYTVTHRRNEIGVRLALGADRRDVLRLIGGEAVKLVALGLAVGTALSVAASRSVRALLFGVEPFDPTTLLLGIAGLALIGGFATLIPAARAARLDPTIALREE